MGRGNRTTTASSTRASGSEKKNEAAHRRFTREGFKLIEAAIAQGEEARFAKPGKNGRYSSQKAENAFLRSMPKAFEFQGEEAQIITSMPEIGWRRSNERYWIDFAIKYGDNVFPFNFKFGQGDGSDNVGSFGTLAYLLGGEMDHPLRPVKIENRQELSDLVSGVLSGTAPEEKYPTREYFCLHYNASQEDLPYSDRFRTLAVSQLLRENMVWNTSNGLQVNFPNAQHVSPMRSRAEARLVLAEGIYGLFKKLADPFHSIQENVDPQILERIDRELRGEA